MNATDLLPPLLAARAPRAPLAKIAIDVPESLLDRVAARYAEPHRRYHTWTHVLACLDAKSRLTDAALPEVDLALIFHDAVHDPVALDNEARSAELLLAEGRWAWLDDRLLQRAQKLVRATAHHAAAEDDSPEACLVVDADLSILGADRETFEAYEQGVRAEYAMFDDAAYAAGRGHVLRGFLARPAIYATRRGRRLWEAPARANLARSLAAVSR